jgi:DtxR family Mn-dependent transcriptional regulator
MSINLSDREEDYLRGIHELVDQNGYTRIRDISKKLGVSPPSAVQMMRKLDGKKLVVYEKYGGVTLTSKGREIATVISNRHETFRKFLKILLVPKEIAVKDAHILEHHLDPKTILQFNKFVEFIASADERPRFVSRWREMFKKYCDKKESTIEEGALMYSKPVNT